MIPVRLRYIFLLCLQCIYLFASGANPSRKIISFNNGWQFKKDSSAEFSSIVNLTSWQSVRIPHTWNAFDVMDDQTGYYRGNGIYRKTLRLNEEQKHKNLFIQFEAAGQQAILYVNGKKVATHYGGYTQFIVPLTNYLTPEGENELLLAVDNKYNEHLPPLTADFTFFGGLYRDVSLIETNKAYFGDHVFGAHGVYVSTPKVSSESADVSITAKLNNSLDETQRFRLKSTIYSFKNEVVKSTETAVILSPGEELSVSQQIMAIRNPTLWSPQRPYLYKIKTQLLTENGQTYDEIVNPLAFRWFSFDAETGFFLNGKHLKLIGASRHQDFKNMGNAVPNDLQVKDIHLLKEMGGNFLRVAHYPQSKAVLDACDTLGIITSVEIPIVNEITESEEFTNNSLHMQTEMIRQYHNHPSVILWAYMNEVLLRPKFNEDKERQNRYFNNIRILAQRLEDLTRKEDPYRYTMIAHHGNFRLYNQVGLNDIAMVVGWNLYQGWYGGKIEDFGKQLDVIHNGLKDKPLLVTEYGADVDPRINSQNPIRFDKSIEYGIKYHLGYIKDILDRPFVAGAMAWNLSDFSSETREETMPHINNKGLLTLDRKPKDTYYLYKAKFGRKPFVKISNWTNRAIVSDGNTSVEQVTVLSNLEKLKLNVNGIVAEEKSVLDNIVSWSINLKKGINDISVEGLLNGEIYKDSAIIYLNTIPSTLKKYDFDKPLMVSFGDIRTYTDTLGNVWVPEREFSKGSWGFIGGQALFNDKSPRQKYGVDKNIFNTEDDPLYQTQRFGIKQLIFDVPRGTYQIDLLFADYNDEQTKLLYNLNESAVNTGTKIQDNEFSIKLNGKPIAKNINIVKEIGYFTAFQKSVTAKASAKGLIIEFDAHSGQSIINAIKISKIN